MGRDGSFYSMVLWKLHSGKEISESMPDFWWLGTRYVLHFSKFLESESQRSWDSCPKILYTANVLDAKIANKSCVTFPAAL